MALQAVAAVQTRGGAHLGGVAELAVPQRGDDLAPRRVHLRRGELADVPAAAPTRARERLQILVDLFSGSPCPGCCHCGRMPRLRSPLCLCACASVLCPFQCCLGQLAHSSPFLFAAGRGSVFLKKGPLLSWHARNPQQALPKYKAGGHFSQNRWAIKSRKSGKPAYRQCAVPTGWVSKSCEQVGQCLPPQCCQTIAPNRTFAKSVSTVKTRKRQKPHPPELRVFKTKGSTDTWPAHGPQD